MNTKLCILLYFLATINQVLLGLKYKNKKGAISTKKVIFTVNRVIIKHLVEEGKCIYAENIGEACGFLNQLSSVHFEIFHFI